MVLHLADPDGIVLRRDVIAAGYDDRALRRHVRRGLLVRLRQGAYVTSAPWGGAADADRHLLLARAVLRQYDGRDVALSHTSACVYRGAPTWGLDLSQVHLTHLDGRGERTAGLVAHHRGVIHANHISRMDGHWMTSPARAVLETATLAPTEPAVCLLDWHLRSGLVSRREFESTVAEMREWPNSLSLQVAVALADGRSDSVGETRSRLLFLRHQLPMPELQWRVHHPDGKLAGISDFGWPEHGVLGEFDGKAKYLRLRRPYESIEEAILREKRREDTLRELTGWRMIRLSWADLNDEARTAARVRRALGLD